MRNTPRAKCRRRCELCDTAHNPISSGVASPVESGHTGGTTKPALPLAVAFVLIVAASITGYSFQPHPAFIVAAIVATMSLTRLVFTRRRPRHRQLFEIREPRRP